jgi:hypothetical protein
MPFKSSSLPDQIRAARGGERQQIEANPTPTGSGAAQRAKESAARWTQSSMGNPGQAGANPWFSGAQPFSEQRFQNAKNYDTWKGKFLNETDMGWKFAPPPPEPATPAASPAPKEGEA